MINKYLTNLFADSNFKEIFPGKYISLQFIEGKKNLKEMLAPPFYPKSVNNQVDIKTRCNYCDICKHYLVAEMKFTSKTTGKTGLIKEDLSCSKS